MVVTSESVSPKMPKALKIPGLIQEWMKECSDCGTRFIGTRLVELHFPKNKRTADGHTYECKQCLKRKRDTTRASGRGFLDDLKNLFGCQAPDCACTAEEKSRREASCLAFHHADPASKAYNPAHGTQKRFWDQHKELGKCILLCSEKHRAAHKNDGSLTPYGLELLRGHNEAQAQIKRPRRHEVGAGKPPA
jgi:hypothetical protein